MGRLILGIIAGIIAAVATIWCVDMVNHMIHPLPRSLSIHDREGLGDYISAMPPLALSLVAASWFLGALVGGLVAAWVARRDIAIGIVGIVVVIAAVGNLLIARHPVVLQVAAFVAPLVGTFIGRMIYRRRRPAV
jgi:hypothetical protein